MSLFGSAASFVQKNGEIAERKFPLSLLFYASIKNNGTIASFILRLPYRSHIALQSQLYVMHRITSIAPILHHVSRPFCAERSPRKAMCPP